MPEIEGDLDSFAVIPTQYAPLRRFCCGKRESRPEREVNTMTREYSRGKRPCEAFRVTVEMPSRIVGIAAFQPATFSDAALAPINGFPYISVIGLSEHFRGRTKNGVRMGDHVLLDVLRAINAHERWGGTPDIFALVDPNNKPSCDLFQRHGFQVVINADPTNPEADSLFGRPGMAIP